MRFKRKQSGLAMIELVPLLIIFVIFVNYGVGMWGAVHTGILHSIAARNYTFETLRHRGSYNYLRTGEFSDCRIYNKVGFRFHAVVDDTGGASQEPTATARRISMVQSPRGLGDSPSEHLKVYGIQGQNRNVRVSPIWVKVGYGICLRANCR